MQSTVNNPSRIPELATYSDLSNQCRNIEHEYWSSARYRWAKPELAEHMRMRWPLHHEKRLLQSLSRCGKV